jgi:hypothetical protein
MKISKNSMVLTAAFAGLLGGTMSRVNAAPVTAKTGVSLASATAVAGVSTGLADTDKHACKGKNSCKGKGGCSSDGSMDKKK